MNKILSFVLSVFFVVGLSLPSLVLSQDAGTSPPPADTTAAQSPPADSPATSPAPAETKPPESPATQPATSPVDTSAPTQPAPTEVGCPSLGPAPTCGSGETMKKAVDDHGCIVGQYCVKLEGGEQPRSCPLVSKDAFDDCRNSGGNPSTQTAPDGCAILTCERQEGSQPQGPPPGCREEVDPAGFKRFVCEGPKGPEGGCPPDKQQMEERNKQDCISKGGNPIAFHDPNGCQFFNCEFRGKGQRQGGFIGGAGQSLGLEKSNCPTRKDVDEQFKRCADSGQEGFLVGPEDCRFVECRNVEAFKDQFRCDEGRNFVNFEKLAQECGGSQNVREDWDASGCRFPRCAKPEERGDERRGPPPEFFDRCKKEGGQIADFGGKPRCIPPKSKGKLQKGLRQDEILSLSEIKPGDILKLATKLEIAKVALNEAKNELENLANYWDQQNSPAESDRFRKAMRILEKTNDRIDKVKKKLAAKIDDITVDSLAEIKNEIKTTIERVEVDATSALLGGEVKEAVDTEIDTEGLEENAELCVVGKFNVDTGQEGPEVSVDIKGIDDDGDCNGSMKVSFAKSSFKPPIPTVTEATCKDIDVLAATAGGDRPPTKEELAKAGCKGTFVDNLDKMMPGIPGKCEGEECKDYCGTSETAAKECLEAFKDMLPPEAKVGLTLMTALGGSPDKIREGFENAMQGGKEGAKAFLAKIESALQSAGVSLDQVPGDMKQGLEMLKAISEGKAPSFGGKGGSGFGGEGGPEGGFGFGDFGGDEDHGFVGPGGCRGPAECDAYCSKNPEECSKAFGREEGGERVRDQFGREFRVNANNCPPGEYPGVNDRGQPSCIRPESGSRGFSQPRNFERFRPDESKFIGPGGCKTKAECEAQFRNNPDAFKSSFGSEFRPPENFRPQADFNQPNQPFPPPSGDFGNYQPPPSGDFGNYQPPPEGGLSQPPSGFFVKRR